MCFVVACVMFALSIQNFLQHQYMTGGLQLMIALGFTTLLVRNVLAVKNQKKDCTATGCDSMNWFTKLSPKKEN